MVRKGKFKLLSFLTEKHLIYYKSINKNDKLVAFSILKINNLLKIIPLLNDFLLKNFLFYYSVQINVAKNGRKTIILTFIGNDKPKIDKFFNLIFQRIREYDQSSKFLKNHRLEKQFFHILSNKIDKDINTLKLGDSLIIKRGDSEKFLYIYEINCDIMQNDKVSLHNLLKALNNFNQKGYIIFNIQTLNSGKIVSNAYFINIRYEKDNKSIDIKEEINILFNYDILNKSVIHLNHLNCLVWRANFSENFYKLTHDSDIFLSLSNYNFQDLSKFSVQFHKTLRLNQVDFHQLKPNLFFIEEKTLFLILDSYNPIEISRILEKFFSKYFVIILILNVEEYNKLNESSEIRLLDNVKTINFRDFIEFDVNKLKYEFVLENT